MPCGRGEPGSGGDGPVGLPRPDRPGGPRPSMRVLALIGDRTNPPITGTRVRNDNLWPEVARAGAEVKILGLDLGYSAAGDSPPRLRDLDAEFFRTARPSLPVRVANAYTRSWHEHPVSPALIRRVDEVAAAWKPDVIHAEELRMGRYLPGARGRAGPWTQSLTLHNVESLLYRTIGASAVPIGKTISKRLHDRSLARFERRVIGSADLAFAYSSHDRKLYEAMIPGVRWSETRNGSAVRDLVPAPQPENPGLLLVASWSYRPNVTGLLWFLDEVAPHLPAGARITVAGSGASADLKARLAASEVNFVDTPVDLAPLYAENAVVIVPVLEGSGTRGKILEALAHERVVVTTTKGPEGLDLAPGEGIVVADGAGPFTDAVAEVMMSPQSRAAIARQGREAVLSRYDWSIVAAGLLGAWTRCTSP